MIDPKTDRIKRYPVYRDTEKITTNKKKLT